MITIRIGDSERELDTADEHWINDQISRRRQDKAPPCVRVSIRKAGFDMVLSTPTCGGGGSGGRAPNEQERAVFELWEKRGLSNNDFTGGSVVAFLKQLRNLC